MTGDNQKNESVQGESYKITTSNLNLFYGKFQALFDINLKVRKNKITALIGPSGCGKSSLLRCLNRMNDSIEGARIEGDVKVDGKNIYQNGSDVTALRSQVGMVYQRPNPFPLSVFDNCIYGARVHGIHNRKQLEEIARKSLTRVLLWDELKNLLSESALFLSDEQKQRLCMARVLALNTEVLLLDEPCSQLDPLASQKIEELLVRLKKKYTIIIVTHNMQQAARISDYTGFFHLGEMIEFDRTEKIFTAPAEKKTEDYIQGRFG